LALAELKFTKCGVQIPPSYFPTFLFKGCFLTAHWSGSTLFLLQALMIMKLYDGGTELTGCFYLPKGASVTVKQSPLDTTI